MYGNDCALTGRVRARRLSLLAAAFLVVAALPTADASAQAPLGVQLKNTNYNTTGTNGNIGDWTSRMYTGVQRAAGRPNDMFISRADGKIFRVDLTTNTQSLFYQLPAGDYNAGGGYYGVLGFTFAPDFGTSGKLYVHVADDLGDAAIAGTSGSKHRIYVREYTLNNPLSNSPTLASQKNIIRWDNPLSDHSGGWLGFQPDNPNILWILGGDGGNNDGNPNPLQGPTNSTVETSPGSGTFLKLRTGQDKADLLGSLLRVDLSGDDYPASANYNYKVPVDNPFYNPGGPDPDPANAADGLNDAIWTIGNRSPWGASFDRQTGDFIWGEVGQVTREEVNFQRKPDAGGYGAVGGRNYGWRILEGTLCANRAEYAGNECNSPGSPPLSTLTSPIYDYVHSGGYGSGGATQFRGRAVVGGYVYRGPVTALQGKYIFGDSSSHQIWSMSIDRNANGGLGGVVPGTLDDLSQEFNLSTNGGTSALVGVTAFGEDSIGNLYFLELGGSLYKITGVPEPATAVMMLIACAAVATVGRRRRA
jgi:hypothetical protein